MFKTGDFRQVLEIQERNDEGVYETQRRIHGHIKVSGASREVDYSTNQSPSVTHIFTTRFTGDISRGSRISSNGINFTIASQPEFLMDERKRYLEIRTYREEGVEVIAQIESEGRDVTLLIPQAPSNNDAPWDPRNGATDAAEQTVKAFQSQFSSFEIDGSNILSSDIRYLVSGDIEIAANMKIRDGNQTYDIVRVTPLRPGNETFLNLIQAR